MQFAEPEATCLLTLAVLAEHDQPVFITQLLHYLRGEPEQTLPILLAGML